jgi:hypothetical protein
LLEANLVNEGVECLNRAAEVGNTPTVGFDLLFELLYSSDFVDWRSRLLATNQASADTGGF